MVHVSRHATHIVKDTSAVGIQQLKGLLSTVGLFLCHKYHIPIDNTIKGCIIETMNVLEQYIDVFENLDADEIYESMISLGSSVAYEVDRDAKNFVHGCQSQVWVEGDEQPTGWEFKLDSESYMFKGIGNVLCRCMSGMTAEEIDQITFYDFRDLTQYFSQQRKQGMQAVINKCKQISRG